MRSTDSIPRSDAHPIHGTRMIRMTAVHFSILLLLFSSGVRAKSSETQLEVMRLIRLAQAPIQKTTAEQKPSQQDRKTAEIVKHCDRHFSGSIQAEVRLACAASAQDFPTLGRALVETRCRLNYGEEPRLVMACLIGAGIADDVFAGREDFKRQLQLCSETYPVQNEIDAFLQESCLTGTLIPKLMNPQGRARFEACAQITPERSFLGPCAVGLGLALESSDPALTPRQQNQYCDQYFNSQKFHKGYRACLNARGLVTDLRMNARDALKDCANILTESNNDTEKAACLVGLTIHRRLLKKADVQERFAKCGDNKVTFQDRDFLACLTAASLLDFSDKNSAEASCREIFSQAKSRSRSDCVNSLALF